jgi:hypothetical protein
MAQESNRAIRQAQEAGDYELAEALRASWREHIEASVSALEDRKDIEAATAASMEANTSPEVPGPDGHKYHKHCVPCLKGGLHDVSKVEGGLHAQMLLLSNCTLAPGHVKCIHTEGEIELAGAAGAAAE